MAIFLVNMDIEWTYIFVNVHGDNFINILLHNTMGNGWSVLQEISPTPGWNRTRKLCTLWNVTVVFSLGFLSGGQGGGLLFLLLYRHSYLEGRTITLFLRSFVYQSHHLYDISCCSPFHKKEQPGLADWSSAQWSRHSQAVGSPSRCHSQEGCLTSWGKMARRWRWCWWGGAGTWSGR